jgi:hypothetical protein
VDVKKSPHPSSPHVNEVVSKRKSMWDSPLRENVPARRKKRAKRIKSLHASEALQSRRKRKRVSPADEDVPRKTMKAPR